MVRVVLADDHKIVRDGLRSMLEKLPKFEVIAEAENGRRAVQLAAKLRPHVLIMDVGMPELNGIEATRQIKEQAPDTKVIILSMHSDKRFISRALQSGASGYLLKDCAFEELDNAIHCVLKNQIYLSPGIAGVVVEDYVQQLTGTRSSAQEKLTPREREILQLIAEGKATKDVAHSLHVSVKTVETYRRQIMEKLNLNSVAELTKYAIREGLTSIEE